ncbi:hypothetical protein W2_gp054 [Caulobacter phage W2]|uniref:Uncharacterized protein n=1 Tax=Caulobacter phage TMCBR4 TaxID=3028191 RepID=A0AAE9ZHU4_9CAUD|nr:hypothetical protein TMCBR4_gp055 [Caulobacter phage TMCBR4]WDS38422.1 hypothetical protein W2_gp054 [Caulobacter phage W2]
MNARCTCDRKHATSRFQAGDTHQTVKCTACGATWRGGKAPPPFERETIDPPRILRREVIETTKLGDAWRSYELGRIS